MRAQRLAKMDAILFDGVSWLITPAQQRNNGFSHGESASRWRLFAGPLFLHKKAADDQRIHTRAEKSTHRVGRSMHDSLAAQIERSVHDHRNAGALLELVKQTPVQWIDVFLYSLRPCAPVHVPNGGNHAALL